MYFERAKLSCSEHKGYQLRKGLSQSFTSKPVSWGQGITPVFLFQLLISFFYILQTENFQGAFPFCFTADQLINFSQTARINQTYLITWIGKTYILFLLYNTKILKNLLLRAT